MIKNVSIPTSHFIGNGEIPFLFVDRVVGDDEDTATLILANGIGEAQELFADHLHNEADNDDEARAELVAEHGCDHIITSDTPLT